MAFRSRPTPMREAPKEAGGSAAPAETDELVFLPLGGCGEIGMNLNAYGFGKGRDRRWLLIDFGVTFPDEREPGIELIFPDIDFIEGEKDRILGLVLTHAHEDHMGAVPYLWDRLQCPVYASPFTAALLGAKLRESGQKEPVITRVPLGGKLSLGPFALELISLTHSIPEPSGVAITTPVGLIFHTGDWKIDTTPMEGKGPDKARLKKLGSENVHAIVCDSTNVFSPGRAGSERVVRETLTRLIGEKKGRVAVTTFASNVARLATVAAAAAANDRHIVLIGRAMHRVRRAAQETGYLKEFPETLSDEDAGYLPPDKVLYLCTGSQGEPRAALARIAGGDHPQVTLGHGDTVIFSSKTIPGNERVIGHVQNQLMQRGVEVIDDHEKGVHVSGHPCRDELTDMYGWVKPRFAIPVHGEVRHLQEHARLATSLGVEEAFVIGNGDVLKLGPGTPQVIEEVPHGRLHLDGEVIVPAASVALRERRKISYSGYVVVTLTLGEGGNILVDPMVLALGLPNLKGMSGRTLVEVLEDDIENALLQLGRRRRDDDDAVEEAVRRAVRSRLRSAWNKRPGIEVQIIRMDEDY